LAVGASNGAGWVLLKGDLAMAKFLDQLKHLLENTTQIDKTEVKEATRLIRERRWELNLRREGPCLICKAGTIQYGQPCTTHIQKGDTWLDSLFEKWPTGPAIIKKQYHRNIFINGYALKTVARYVCENCKADLDGQVSTFEKQELQEVMEKGRKKTEHEQALIRGNVKGTIPQRFRALERHISKEAKERLKEMPYEEFLGTIYWDIVRRYVLWKRKFICGLCNSDGQLNVHHKTYDHRGEEYLFLEDLIVLCQPCHAKFHDKLAA